jgi:outer membrane protein TolC
MTPANTFPASNRFILSLIFLILMSLVTHGQKAINLEECLKSAVSASPVASNYNLLEQISAKKLGNIESSWFPSMELSGRASYQSDVTMIDVELPLPGISFPIPAKDQYRISLDLKQSIYDGGRSKQLTELEKTSLSISQKSIDIEMNKLKEQVKNLFYQCLLLQSSLQAAELSLARMTENEKILEAGMKSGIHLQSDFDLFRIEVLKIETLIYDLKTRQNSLLSVLSEKSGISIGHGDTLQLTAYTIPNTEAINRAELSLFDLNIELSENSSRMASVKRKPAVYAFAQAGYGRPGLNMLSDSFDPWYMAGAGFSWAIWDWGQVKREKESYKLSSEITRNKKEDLQQQLNSALAAQKAVINSYSGNIGKYRQVLALRTSITDAYRSRLENGTVRAIDFLTSVDEERLAKINLVTQEILLQKAIADYLFIAGNL